MAKSKVEATSEVVDDVTEPDVAAPVTEVEEPEVAVAEAPASNRELEPVRRTASGSNVWSRKGIQ